MRFLIPIALFAGLSIYSTTEIAPGAAAETGFLALLSAAVLLPAAALLERRQVELGLLAVLVSAAIWAVVPGPTRGAAVALLLVFALALGAMRRLGSGGDRLSWTTATCLALGAQLLARSELLLAPVLGLETLVRCFALPLLAAATLMVLARRHREGDLLIVAAALFALGPGWTVVNTLTLAALAAASALDERSMPLAARLAGLLAVLGVAGWQDPRLAVLLSLTAAAYLLRDSRAGLAVLGLGALLVPLVFPHEWSWLSAAGRLAWLPLLLPAAFATARVGAPRVLAVGALGLGGLCLLPAPAALAAPIALLGVNLPPAPSARRLQSVWSAALVMVSTLLLAYPWFRERPSEDAVALFGLSSGWLAALIVVALVVGGGGALDRWGSSRRLPLPAGAAATLGVGLLLIAAGLALPAAPGLPLAGRVVELNGSQASWTVDLAAPAPASEIVLDSHLSGSRKLPGGTPVATVRLIDADGASAEWILRSGADTGEWAARRPDLAAAPGAAAPTPWLSWVAPGGFFGQRYRGRHAMPSSLLIRRVEVTRVAALPADVGLAVFHLGLVP